MKLVPLPVTVIPALPMVPEPAEVAKEPPRLGRILWPLQLRCVDEERLSEFVMIQSWLSSHFLPFLTAGNGHVLSKLWTWMTAPAADPGVSGSRDYGGGHS